MKEICVIPFTQTLLATPTTLPLSQVYISILFIHLFLVNLFVLFINVYI